MDIVPEDEMRALNAEFNLPGMGSIGLGDMGVTGMISILQVDVLYLCGLVFFVCVFQVSYPVHKTLQACLGQLGIARSPPPPSSLKPSPHLLDSLKHLLVLLRPWGPAHHSVLQVLSW